MAATAPETRSINPIAALTTGWDARIDANYRALAESIKVVKWTVITPGSTAPMNPSVIRLELAALDGAALSASAAKESYLRLRLCQGDDGWALSTNATMTVTSGTNIEDLAPATPNKDLVVRTSTGGLLQVSVTLTIAGFFTLRTGPAPVGTSIINHRSTHVQQHA